MKSAKVLTDKELSLLVNAEILYLKNSALLKIKELLQHFQVQIQNSESLSKLENASKIKFVSSKIAKGENYLSLPYQVLDFPAQFSSSSIFAFRTLFWWGNFFSFTLHLQGEVLEKFRYELLAHVSQIIQSEFYICIHESPWEHHFKADNYKKANAFDAAELAELFSKNSFVKLSYKIDLKDYESLEESGLDTFRKMIYYLGIRFN